MKKQRGRVIEVFIPDDFDTKIGFKVDTNEGIKEIILEQDHYNAQILREDEVILTEQMIHDKYVVGLTLEEDDE